MLTGLKDYVDGGNRGCEWKRETVVVRGMVLETDKIWRVTQDKGWRERVQDKISGSKEV